MPENVIGLSGIIVVECCKCINMSFDAQHCDLFTLTAHDNSVFQQRFIGNMCLSLLLVKSQK